MIEDGCRVLVCDDRVEIRIALSEVLINLDGFEQVGEAADGTACLAGLGATRPDLLILDVSMAQGGPSLARAAKEILPDLIIVVFTALRDRDTKASMLAAGADYYVVKTGRLQPLTDALRSASADRSLRLAAVSPRYLA